MSLLIRTDVTAVKLHEKNIIAGIGSSVYIYSKETFHLLNRIPCLNGQKVYGLISSQNDTKLIVFGGKQFTVLILKPSGDNFEFKKAFKSILCVDWLHSAAWISIHRLAVLTAHNTVQIWDTLNQLMVSEHLSTENSILYSGLLVPLRDDVLVFAGTVFSDIIIHTPNENKPLQYLKGHRGVIFSISADLNKSIVVSTSDDRSVRIWEVLVANSSNNNTYTTEFWKNATVTCKHEIYGHTARVMRSCITEELVISVGEDAAICYWDLNGKLLKKTQTHQNGSIWSMNADKNHLITGGGDCAVILHPLPTADEIGQKEVINLNTTPKKIVFTARRNLVILDDKDNLIHYNVSDKTQTIIKLNHESTYKLMSISNCKQLIAVSDMTGKLDVFAESCKDKAALVNLVDTKLDLNKILSMQWAGNRHLVFCSEFGVVTVLCSNNFNLDIYAEFILPPCKERWLTACSIDTTNNVLIVGDRCGNVHVYRKNKKNPIKSFNKVNGRYGPTSIVIKNNMFITTGRDGTIKYFSLNPKGICLAKYMSSKDLEFPWVEKFISKSDNLICGFQERTFIVFDVKNYSKVLEVQCGGGHRSWDVLRYIDKTLTPDGYDEFINFAYVKNSDVYFHIFKMSRIVSHYVINSSHSKEINCLKTFKNDIDDSVTFYISGGEDTTLRVSSMNSEMEYKDEVIFKHLSNVRTLKTVKYRNGVLIVSAGGRSQICIKSLEILKDGCNLMASVEELVDFLIKGADKERKHNQTWRNSTIDFDPETRIMDLDIVNVDTESFVILAGCSDGYVRSFSFCNGEFKPLTEVKRHKTCILKTVCLKVSNRNLLITCTTRGEISLWDVTNPVNVNLKPFFTTQVNKCGINSIDTTVISDNEVLIATGGDDNAIHLTLIDLGNSNDNSTSVKSKWSNDNFHCAQVTGLAIVDEFLVSTSIDQRVTLVKWKVDSCGVHCEFRMQVISDVADIQGLEVLSSCWNFIEVCVFGKGLEVFRMPKTPSST